MPRLDEHQFLNWALQGHPEAVAFVEAAARISQTWDDLVDGDAAVASDRVNEAFWEAMTLPENLFYAQHYHRLQPVMQTAMADWMAANTLERNSDHGRNLAFVLRDNLAALITQCALLIGGYEWMRQVAPAVRWHVHEEPLATYKEDLP